LEIKKFSYKIEMPYLGPILKRLVRKKGDTLRYRHNIENFWEEKFSNQTNVQGGSICYV